MKEFPAWDLPSSPLAPLWAKSGDESGYMPLTQHMADSGQVAWELYEHSFPRQSKAFLQKELELSDAHLRRFLTWITAVHDCGKISVSFLEKIRGSQWNSNLYEEIEDFGLSLTPSAAELSSFFPHALVSGALLKGWLVATGMHLRAANSLAWIVNAHHGVASTAQEANVADEILEDYPGAWKDVQKEVLDWAAEATGVREILATFTRPLSLPAIQLITGYVVHCDWIASNTLAFPMAAQADPAPRAQEGIEQLQITHAWEPTIPLPADGDPTQHYAESFDWPEEFTLRPVQAAITRAIEGSDGAALVIIEAPTGTGKTEAALQCATYLASITGAQGLIIGAPTMATADGLFRRVSEWAGRQGDISALYSMYLAHSKNALNQNFQSLRIRGIGEDRAEASGSLVATDWLSGSKKGLLSNFVVATVDQILMMALQMRHSMLRHLGLAGKVVIIDEVHAYGTWSNQYLETALRWLACYGVPVILLSATLPHARKAELVRAYGEELLLDQLEVHSEHYPLITTVDSRGVVETPVSQEETEIHASVALIDDSLDDALNVLDEHCSEGGCALVVCTTIRRAQNFYEALESRYPGQVELHHSAFTAHDRAQRERQLLDKLGPSGERPQRAFIVGTQVLEQSLDIDADILITDIAPLDLLVQRIGRLHRHRRDPEERPEALRTPRVFLRGITALSPVPEFDRGVRAVYEPKVLLQTLDTLQKYVLDQGFDRPNDINPLIQGAYVEDFEPPAAWNETWEEAVAEHASNDERARHYARVCRIPEPYKNRYTELFERLHQEDTTFGDEKAVMQVRDIAPSFEVCAVQKRGEGYVPVGRSEVIALGDVPDIEASRRILESSVRLPAFLAGDRHFDTTLRTLEDFTPCTWQQAPFLRHRLCLMLDENLEAVIGPFCVKYDHSMGLRVTSNKDE